MLTAKTCYVNLQSLLWGLLIGSSRAVQDHPREELMSHIRAVVVSKPRACQVELSLVPPSQVPENMSLVVDYTNQTWGCRSGRSVEMRPFGEVSRDVDHERKMQPYVLGVVDLDAKGARARVYNCLMEMAST